MRFRPFASIAEAGFVDALSGQWNEWYFDELEQFLGDGKQYDDALDATVSAFWYLTQSVNIPDMVLTDYSGSSSPFNFAGSFGQQALEFPVF